MNFQNSVFCYSVVEKRKKRGREKVREMPAVRENFSCLLCSFTAYNGGNKMQT